MLGGITADGEECSKPQGTSILCGPTPNKTSRSWYSDLDADPWLAYMFETCKTVGRFDESAAKLRARFLASEQSAVETEFQDNVLDTATSLGAFASVLLAVASLEAGAGGGSSTAARSPCTWAFLAAAAGLQPPGGLTRVGDHLETTAGTSSRSATTTPTTPGAPTPPRWSTPPGPPRSTAARWCETGPVLGTGCRRRLQQRLLRADRAWLRSPGRLLHGQCHRHPVRLRRRVDE